MGGLLCSAYSKLLVLKLPFVNDASTATKINYDRSIRIKQRRILTEEVLNMNTVAQTITLEEALQRPATEPLYVLNTYTDSKSLKDGEVYFTVREGLNDLRAIRVPSTWVPVEMYKASRQAILDSQGFRIALRNGALKIASPEYVKSLGANSAAQDEFEHQRKLEQAFYDPNAMEELTRSNVARSSSAGNVSATGDIATEVDVLGEMTAVQASNNAISVDIDKDESDEVANNPKAVNNAFKTFVAVLNDMTEVEARSRILKRGPMSIAQVEYLSSRLVHKAISSKLAAVLASKAKR